MKWGTSYAHYTTIIHAIISLLCALYRYCTVMEEFVIFTIVTIIHNVSLL